MPIIKCPGCHKRISDEVERCPLCSYRFVKCSKNSKVVLNIVLMMLVFVCAFIAVVAFTLGNTGTGSAAAVVVIICLIKLFTK
jgi:hypothetical protein